MSQFREAKPCIDDKVAADFSCKEIKFVDPSKIPTSNKLVSIHQSIHFFLDAVQCASAPNKCTFPQKPRGSLSEMMATA